MYASFVPGYNRRSPATANLITGANLTSWKQWVAGLQFGFAGFTVGGSIGYDNNGLGGNYYTGVDNDSRKYAPPAMMYETGPWQMSFGWGASSTPTTATARRRSASIAPGHHERPDARRAAGHLGGLLRHQPATPARLVFGSDDGATSSRSASTTRSDRASR